MKMKTVYGIDFEEDYPQHMIDILVARYYNIPRFWYENLGVRKTGKELGLPDPDLCMCRAIRALLNPETEFKLNPWSEDIIHGFCNYRETVVLGSASCSKSETIGVISPFHWVADPKNTTINLVSTDKNNLKKRCWSSAIRTFEILQKYGLPGVHNRQMTSILNASDVKKDMSDADVKAGIHGLAVAGSVDTVIGRLIGVHHPKGSVVLITDETQSINAEIFGAGLTNMMIGTEDFRMIAVGNPLHATDPLCERGEPKASWASVTVDDDHWESARGAYVIHFNGEKSPGLEHPDEYPFLIRQCDIDNVLADVRGRKTSQKYRTMVQGWFSGGSSMDIIFPTVLQAQYGVEGPPEWLDPDERRPIVAGLDPAVGGDDCVLQLAEYGLLGNGMMGLSFLEPKYLEIKPDADLPIQYQISRQIELIRREHPFPLTHLSVDESGVQLFSDVIEMDQNEKGIHRISFGSRATDRPISAFDDTPANQKYGNRCTELWAALVEFASHGQIRNMPKPACVEFAIRECKAVTPRRLESKADLKKRLKRSPDVSDAAALCLNSAIEELDMLPGRSYENTSGIMAFFQQFMRPRNLADYTPSDFSGGNCLTF